MKKVLNNYILTMVKPRKSFDLLLTNENYVSLSFIFILIPIVAYTTVYVFLTIANAAPLGLTPWLNIPEESYYSINRFLLAPSMLLSWIAATSIIQILCRLYNGTGTFEQTLSVIALSISIAMWGGLIHDLPTSFLSAIGVMDARQHSIAMNSPTNFRTLLWTCYSIYLIAFFILFPLSVKVVHKLNWIKSILIGIFGFIIFQSIFLIFNR